MALFILVSGRSQDSRPMFNSDIKHQLSGRKADVWLSKRRNMAINMVIQKEK